MRTFPAMLCVVLLATSLLPTLATAADRFDLIIYNHDETTHWYDAVNHICYHDGYTGGYYSCGLLVNTGSVAITADEINRARFTVIPADPTVPVRLDLATSNLGLFAPIAPGEALGSVGAYNDTLLDFLLPGETFRNSHPSQVMVWGVRYLCAYEGAVSWDVIMSLGGQEVRFSVLVDDRAGSNYESLGFMHLGVVRVSSSAPVPALPTSWGKLKSLYR